MFTQIYQLASLFSILMYLPLFVQGILIYFTGAICASFDIQLQERERTIYSCISDSIVFNSSFNVDAKGTMQKTGLIICVNKNMVGIGRIGVNPGGYSLIGGIPAPPRVSGSVLYWGTALPAPHELQTTNLTFYRPNGATIYDFKRTVVPKPWQKELGDIIKSGMDAGKRLDGSRTQVVLLCGKPGIGKTHMGVYMSQSLRYYNATIVTGQSVDSLPALTSKGNVVIVLDEVDELFKEISGKNPQRKDAHGITRGVNKSTWNMVIDSIRFSSDVVIIMTSNAPYSEIHAELSSSGNEACIREGRVDIFASIVDDKVVLHDPLQ